MADVLRGRTYLGSAEDFESERVGARSAMGLIWDGKIMKKFRLIPCKSIRSGRPSMKEKSHFGSETTSRRMHGVSALLFAVASLMVLPAGAQRTDDNAVTAAGDAFGNTV